MRRGFLGGFQEIFIERGILPLMVAWVRSRLCRMFQRVFVVLVDFRAADHLVGHGGERLRR